MTKPTSHLTEADAEARAFECGDVVVVPSGVWRAWEALLDGTTAPIECANCTALEQIVAAP